MPNGLYLGNASDLASNMGSMFGGQPHKTGPFQMQQQQQPAPQVTGSGPGYGGQFNPLGAQAVRPTSFGQFDPSYGQNLASAIGGTFQRPQQNQALQFNPFGNLTDANVQYPNLGGGNASLPGLPQTMLQWAQWFNPMASTTNG